jgi:predicted esterase
MKNTFLDFLILQNSAIDLIKEEKYKEAISNLESAKSIFPNKIDRIGHWLSGIYCIQNNKEKALSELKEVLNKGLYWNPGILTNDTDLHLIQDSEEFVEIIQRSEELYNFHKRNSSSLLHTLGNYESETSVTALHWKNSNALDFSEQIVTDELRDRYLFSFVQSSQLFSNGCYHWDDYDVAKTDIENTHIEFYDRFESTIKNRIIFGASQGADTAIKTYFESNRNYDTVIALVPTLSNLDTIEEKLKNHQKTKVKLVIITGDKDYFYNNVLDALPIFERYNIPCKLIVIEGMGHTIPENFEELFEENIK